ncbi:MAG: methyltransferase type 11 [Gemmatimonadetes bacterium]|nr:methyltransferase type 11 [Gemmatimonadota bacterium]
MTHSQTGFRSAVTHFIRNQKILVPPQYSRFYRDYRGREFAFLDVGCGNHSASTAKRWFPQCRYHGIDRTMYNNDETDLASMEEMYEIDLEKESLDPIRDGFYDLVLVNHVIEHLPNGLAVLEALTAKLRPGGRMYIEYPAARSLALPSLSGTLNFCDDDTHVRVYDLKDVANALLTNEMRVLRGGIRRSWLRVALIPVTLPLALVKGNPAVPLWDLLRFAEFIYAEKRSSI